MAALPSSAACLQQGLQPSRGAFIHKNKTKARKFLPMNFFQEDISKMSVAQAINRSSLNPKIGYNFL